MSKTIQSLQLRVSRLERELAALRKSLKAAPPAEPWWKSISGEFKDDPAFAEIVRLGRKLRKADGNR